MAQYVRTLARSSYSYLPERWTTVWINELVKTHLMCFWWHVKMPSHTEQPSLSSQRIPAITMWLQEVAQPGTNGTTGYTWNSSKAAVFYSSNLCVSLLKNWRQQLPIASSLLTMLVCCSHNNRSPDTHRQTYVHTCSAEVRAQRVVHLKSIVYMVLLLGLYADATVRLMRPVPSALCSREARLGPRRRHWVWRE